MTENEDFMTDFSLSQPCVLKMESCYEQAQDLTKKIAEDNIAALAEIDEQRSAAIELQNEFDQKQEELKALSEQYAAKKAEFSKQSMVKLMQQKCADLNKESQQIQKQFKRGEIGIDDYTSQYKAAR